MPSFRVLILIAAAPAAACAATPEPAGPEAPAPFAAISESRQFGVTHTDHADGWTEIEVRLNQTSSRERARDMAWYYAARLGREHHAASLYVAGDEAGMNCKAIRKKDEWGTVAAGDPISMAALLVFTAVYSLVPGEKTWAASPTHRLQVYFSDAEEPAHGITPVPVDDTLKALAPHFATGPSSDTPDTAKEGELQDGPAGITDAGRESWAEIASANAAVCEERDRPPKQMETSAVKHR